MVTSGVVGPFSDRVLLITGAGSGIGAATAARFAELGGRAAFVDRDYDAAAERADAYPGSLAVACDVRDEAQVAKTVSIVAERLSRIDYLVNCAGVIDHGAIEDWTSERWRRVMDTHMGGCFNFTRSVVPRMRSQGSGAIVNVSSISAFVAQRNNAPYGAAKGAMIGFTRQLARDLAPSIRVNAVAPGRVRTGLTEPLFASRADGDVEAGAMQAARFNPQHRVAEAQEIAGPICFLLSPDASFITGAVLVVDGGEMIS